MNRKMIQEKKLNVNSRADILKMEIDLARGIYDALAFFGHHSTVIDQDLIKKEKQLLEIVTNSNQ